MALRRIFRNFALKSCFSDIHTLTDTQSRAIQEFSATIHEISIKAEELAQVAEESLYAKENKQ